MLNATILQLANRIRSTGGATSTALPVTRPVRVDNRGVGSERTAAGRRPVLTVARKRDGTSGALDGTIAVWAANLPNPANIGQPIGNAYGPAAAVATSIRPQSDQVIGDSTTTAFTTGIDMASADLAAAIAAGSILVEMPAFKLTGTFAASAAGTITGSGSKLSAGVSSAAGGGEVKVGDIVTIGGISGTITAIASDTSATWDQTTVIAATAVGFNISRDRRFRFVFAASGAASGDPEAVEATVVASKLVLTFKVAPAAQDIAYTSSIALPAGMSVADPGAAYFVTPTQILADGANEFVRTGILSKTAFWVLPTTSAGGAVSATQAFLEHSQAE